MLAIHIPHETQVVVLGAILKNKLSLDCQIRNSETKEGTQNKFYIYFKDAQSAGQCPQIGLFMLNYKLKLTFCLKVNILLQYIYL